MTHQPNPVLPHENREVRGYALCREGIFRAHVAEVEQLRARQAEYLASLPADPREAISAAFDLICGDGGYPDGLEEALHLSAVLKALIAGDCDCDPAALAYVGMRVMTARRGAADQPCIRHSGQSRKAGEPCKDIARGGAQALNLSPLPFTTGLRLVKLSALHRSRRCTALCHGADWPSRLKQTERIRK